MSENEMKNAENKAGQYCKTFLYHYQTPSVSV